MFDKGFKRYEFACKCGCGFDTVDVELLHVLETLKKELGGVVKINSGCRCSAHNDLVHGLEHSLHLIGKASDIVISGLSPKVVYDYLVLRFPGQYGIGKYKTFTHIDVREKMARW